MPGGSRARRSAAALKVEGDALHRPFVELHHLQSRLLGDRGQLRQNLVLGRLLETQAGLEHQEAAVVRVLLDDGVLVDHQQELRLLIRPPVGQSDGRGKTPEQILIGVIGQGLDSIDGDASRTVHQNHGERLLGCPDVPTPQPTLTTSVLSSLAIQSVSRDNPLAKRYFSLCS